MQYVLSICRKAKLLAELEVGSQMPVAKQTEEGNQLPIVSHTDDSSQLQAELELKVQEMASIRERVFTDAAANISKAQARYKKDYDKKRKPNEVCIVFLYA